MSKPINNPSKIATNNNYSTGPFPGLATKVSPTSGTNANGLLPGEEPSAEVINYILNNHGEWIEYNDNETKTITSAIQRQNRKYGIGRDTIDYQVTDGDIDALIAGGQLTYHDCFGGLLVRPDNAGYLLVDKGSAGFILPGWVSANDNEYIIVNDPGVTSNSVLTFTSNASGSSRCDIVECQPSDASGSSLNYRIRLGTPGDGIPLIEQEWMPIAVVIVRDGATGFDVCDVYDCRPLISERNTDPTQVIGQNSTGLLVTNRYQDINCLPNANSGNKAVSGYFDTDLAGYKSAGDFRMNCPSTVNFGVDSSVVETAGDSNLWYVENEDNWLTSDSAPGTTDGDLNYIMIVRPRGLGRWVRYSQSPVTSLSGGKPWSGRIPRGPNGMIALGRSLNVKSDGSCVISGMPRAINSSGAVGHGCIIGWTVHNGTINLPAKCINRHFTFPYEASYNTFPLDWSFQVTPSQTTPYSFGLSWEWDMAPTGSNINKTVDGNKFPQCVKKLDVVVRASWLFDGDADSLEIEPIQSEWFARDGSLIYEQQPHCPYQFYPKGVSGSSFTKKWNAQILPNSRGGQLDGGGAATSLRMDGITTGFTFADGGTQATDIAIVGWSV